MSLPPAAAERAQAGRWLALAAAILGWMFDGFEMGLFPLVARPAMKELLGADAFIASFGWWDGFITAGFLIGAALGGVLFGWLGDRIGRVRAMTISVLAYSLFSGLGAFATAPWHVAASRLVAALGMGGEWALGVALVMEVFPATSRPLMAGMIGAASNLGFLLVGLLGLGVTAFVAQVGAGLGTVLPTAWAEALVRHDGWRLLMLVGAVPALLTLLIRLFVPESERWKHAAALAPQPRIGDIFRGGIGRLSMIGFLLAGVALLGTWASTQRLPGWAGKLTEHLAAGDPIRATAKQWTQIWSAAGACVGTVLAALIAQWTSRRIAYCALALGSLAFCQWFFRSGIGFGGGFLAATFVTGALTASFYGWLPLYLPELFPTRLRATAQGFAFNGGRILAAAGALVSGPLLDHYHQDYGRMGAVISLIYVVGVVAIWFAPETKGRPLPE